MLPNLCKSQGKQQNYPETRYKYDVPNDSAYADPQHSSLKILYLVEAARKNEEAK